MSVTTNPLGTQKIGRLLLEFSLPAIASMVFTALYNVIDAAFLGEALPDGSGVAVATLAYPVMNILMGFSMLAGQGGNALAAIQLGEGKKDAVEKTLGNSAFLLIVLALGIAVFELVFTDLTLNLISTTEDLWEETKSFVTIICCFFVFESLGMGLNNFIRTAGKPNFAMFTMMLGTVMCIAFNWLFVIVLDWGVVGSAWATVCGEACGMVPVLWFFTFGKSEYKLRLRNLVPDFALIGRIVVMGLASFVMQVAASVVSIVFNWAVTRYGTDSALGTTGALAAIGVASRAVGFAFTPIIGLMMGSQPIIGYNHGAKNWERVLAAFRAACIAGAAIGTFFLLLGQIIPEPIVTLLGARDDRVAFAAWSLQVYVIWFGFVGYQAIASSYFQSSGQPIKSAILELTRQVLFLIPLYLVAPPLLAGLFGITALEGVVYCVPLSDIFATIVTTAFVIPEYRKLKRLIEES